MRSVFNKAIAFAALACSVLPAWACSISFTSPANNAVVRSPTVTVTGTASGFANPSAVGTATATVNGRVFFSQTGTFTVLINFIGSGAATATLDPGINRLVVTGSVSGCSASDSITVLYVPPDNLPNPPRNPSPDPSNCPAGNPCDPATGIKEQSETDYRASQRLPLTLSRVYRSAAAAPGSLATGWTAWWDRAVRISTPSATAASLARPDGKSLRYTFSAGAWSADADVNHRLFEMGSGALRTGWRVVTADDQVETYDASGRLLSVADVAGQTLTLVYSDASTPPSVAPRPGLVIRITDTFGRAVDLVYDANGRVTSATNPEGRSYRYVYGVNDTLSTVEAPLGSAGFSTRRYFYNEASRINGGAACASTLRPTTHALTGIEDESTARFASYAYDCQVRAVSTEHAGGVNRYSFVYNVDAAGAPISTAITDPLGTVRTRNFATSLGVVRGTANAEPCSTPGCSGNVSRSYGRDANGNIADHNDFNANRSCYAHDAGRNLQTVRVEGLAAATNCATATSAGAALSAGSRKFTTQWHPDWRVPVRRAEPKKITTLVYNGQPDPFNGNAIASCAPADALLPNGLPIAVVCKRVEQSTTDASGAQGFNATVGNGVAGNGTPATRVWTHTYNRHGQFLTTDGARTDVSDVTTYAYYATTTANARFGDLQQITNALGQTTQFTQYNAHGQVLSMTDANGIVTTMSYDERQRLKTRTQAAGTPAARATTYSYDARGLLSQLTLPPGQVSNAAGAGGMTIGRSFTYTYDDAQRLTGITSASGEQMLYELDGLGNVKREEIFNATAQGGSASVLRRQFDALGRLFKEIRIINGADRTTEFGYDAQGNPTRTLHPPEAGYGEASGPLEVRRYNALNQLTQIEDAQHGAAKPTVLTPDARDQTAVVRAANNATTTYQRDGFDQVLAESGPDRGSVAYAYDAAGNLSSVLDARGVTSTHTWDALNRLVATVYTQAGQTSSENRAYTWDANGGGLVACSNGIGRLCRVSDASGVSHHAFDAFGNLVQQRIVEGGIDRSQLYAYDGEDRLSAITTTAGKALALVRDIEGRANRVLAVVNATAAALVQSTSYRGDGRADATQLGNNVSLDRGFDSSGAPAGMQETGLQGGTSSTEDIPTAPQWAMLSLGALLLWQVLRAKRVGRTLHSAWPVAALILVAAATSAWADETIQYDARGNVKSRSVDGRLSSYQYDRIDRLRQEGGFTSQSFGLDENGNRTSDGQATYTVLANGNRQITRSGVTLTYDPAGNLLSDQAIVAGTLVNRAFTYTLAGQVKTVSINGTLRATYTYNHLSQRTRKVLAAPTAGTPATTLYRYDPSGRLIEEIAGTAASAAGITVTAGRTLLTYAWKDDMPSAVIHAPNSPHNPSNANERVLYLHTDHLDSPRKASDANARVVWSWESDAFGAAAANEDPDADAKKTTINLRFPGQYFDAESGLHYNWHRYYDAATGRYVQSDPIGLAGGINAFAYVRGNPLSFVDSKGLDIEMPMIEPGNMFPTDFSPRIRPRPTYNFCRCSANANWPSAQNIGNTAAAGTLATGAAGAVTGAYLVTQGGSASVIAFEAAHVARFGIHFIPMVVGDGIFAAAVTGFVSGLAIGTGTAVVVGGSIYGVSEYCQSYCESCRR